MSMSFLEALNKAGCIDKQITESDDRFDKVNAAAEKFANDMEPNLLIDGFHSLMALLHKAFEGKVFLSC
ncbi:hypothetical protein [Acinetobacter baumannii]|uniref:hypothetical protein n=1 Tax=Acinetobacter baumannii TaxID=470 RepID=UPI00189B2115|nr:hypothetical protein [Acinetobacter baumannii]MBF6956787.1 hypothetical protein [Acinetobacter baumannii]